MEGDPGKRKSCLPSDKQFLVCRKLPSRALEGRGYDQEAASSEEWSFLEHKDGDNDDTIEKEDMILLSVKNHISNSSTVLHAKRLFDMSICYDNYWRVPRVFITGHHASGEPLKAEELLLDIAHGYAQKTATIDPHPHLPGYLDSISIHPCQHATAMVKIINNLSSQPTLNDFLFLFLKFLQAVVDIEYDFTL